MTVETYVDAALERVDEERDWTAEKRAAFEAFDETVQGVETERPRTGQFSAGGTLAAAASGSTPTGVAAVRQAFADHLEPYSGDALETPDTVHEAIADEFSHDLAVSLASPRSGNWFTPPLEAAVREATARRLDELAVMERTLDRERESLAAAAAVVDGVTAWFVEHNPTPLAERPFDDLRAWHRRLDEHRDALAAVADRRQDHVHATTGGPENLGINHRVLVEYLYAGLDPTYPVLETIARLARARETAKSAVRDHLVRRA